MSNIVSWIPKQNNRIVMYEVLDENSRSEYGSERANEAIVWFARNPLNKRLVVTNWFADQEDAAPIGESVDVTALVLAAMAEGRGRNG
jgi:hypothetical protein